MPKSRMSLRSVKKTGTARVAVVGAPTEEGGRLPRASGRTLRMSGRGCAVRVFRISARRSACTAL